MTELVSPGVEVTVNPEGRALEDAIKVLKTIEQTRDEWHKLSQALKEMGGTSLAPSHLDAVFHVQGRLLDKCVGDMYIAEKWLREYQYFADGVNIESENHK
jgi:hypothetical protein